MDDARLIERLAEVGIFTGMSPRQFRWVAKTGRQIPHPDGAEVTRQDDGENVQFHLVLEGSATVVVDGVARATLGPGDSFGEISLLDGKPRSATVRADRGLRTFALEPWQFNRLLDEHPDMARALLVGLCARLREAESHRSTPHA